MCEFQDEFDLSENRMDDALDICDCEADASGKLTLEEDFEPLDTSASNEDIVEPIELDENGIDDFEPLDEDGIIAETAGDVCASEEAEELLAEVSKGPSFTEAFNDPDLFSEIQARDYSYEEGEYGKKTYGVLELAEDPIRDPLAQKTAGGEDRRMDDDGGHLIGARFGGSPEFDNLDAQNRNLNRGSYKSMENEWADSIQDGNNVFANIETYKDGNSDRPTAYMGYSITESPDGSRNWDAFSFTNESAETQEDWERIIEELD